MSILTNKDIKYLYQLLAFCAFISCHSKANADTFYVEASVRILTEITPWNGGGIAFTLVDDLNHGLPGQNIDISLKHGDVTAQVTVTTDDAGHAEAQMALQEGLWTGNARFLGHDGYLDAETFIEMDVKKCDAKTELRLAQEGVFSENETISFDIGRNHGACLDLPAIYMLSAEDYSQRIELKPGQVQTRIALDRPRFDPGIHRLSLQLIEGLAYRPESVMAEFAVLEPLFVWPPDISKDWLGTSAEIEISPLILQLSPLPDIMAVLTLSPYSQGICDVCSRELPNCILNNRNLERREFRSKNDGSDKIVFDLPDDLTQCHMLALSRDGAGDGQNQYGVYCFAEPYYIRRSLIFQAIFGAVWVLLGLLGYFYFKTRKKRILPKPPLSPQRMESGAPVYVENWNIKGLTRYSAVREMRCLLVCVDDSSGRLIPADRLELTCGGKALECTWPCEAAKDTQICIKHPDYRPWTGLIHEPGRHIIKLKSNRNYVIECYEYVCAKYDSSQSRWGSITPDLLLEKLKNNRLIKQDKWLLLQSFCEKVLAAAYGRSPVCEQDLHEIFDLSRKL